MWSIESGLVKKSCAKQHSQKKYVGEFSIVSIKKTPYF